MPETSTLQRGEYLFADILDTAYTLHTMAGGCARATHRQVKLNQWARLEMIDLQALAHGVFMVVIAQYQWLAGFIVQPIALWRVVLDVVYPT